MIKNTSIPFPTPPTITNVDIDKGYITRYFLKFLSNKIVIEINKSQFDIFAKNSLYQTISFKWYITGNIEDRTDNRVGEGVRTKNQRAINYYSSIMPDLQFTIKGPLQYYKGVDSTT